MGEVGLHPIVAAAAAGEIPPWGSVRPDRRGHMAAVARLLDLWAHRLDLPSVDRARWAAAAWLHDALRDADPAELAEEAGEFPPPVRHGPAAAARLVRDGVVDDELLEAVRWHTLGSPGWGRLGRFLYLADYLEPGRSFRAAERAALRARLPEEADTVLREVCGRRVAWLTTRRLPLHPRTVAFWNELVGRS